jgi:hypothetical protein
MSSSPKSLSPVPVVWPRPSQVTRHRRSAGERESLLARFRRSGQSQKRFCQEQDLPLSTLQYSDHLTMPSWLKYRVRECANSWPPAR